MGGRKKQQKTTNIDTFFIDVCCLLFKKKGGERKTQQTSILFFGGYTCHVLLLSLGFVFFSQGHLAFCGVFVGVVVRSMRVKKLKLLCVLNMNCMTAGDLNIFFCWRGHPRLKLHFFVGEGPHGGPMVLAIRFLDMV